MFKFFSDVFDKMKGAIATLIATGLAYLVYKALSQEKEIDQLKQEKFQSESENEVSEQKGELNDVKKETEYDQKQLNDTNNDLKHNESVLDELKRNRPR